MSIQIKALKYQSSTIHDSVPQHKVSYEAEHYKKSQLSCIVHIQISTNHVHFLQKVQRLLERTEDLVADQLRTMQAVNTQENTLVAVADIRYVGQPF